MCPASHDDDVSPGRADAQHAPTPSNVLRAGLGAGAVQRRKRRRVWRSAGMVVALLGTFGLVRSFYSSDKKCQAIVQPWAQVEAATRESGLADTTGVLFGEVLAYIAKGKDLHLQACLAQEPDAQAEILDFEPISACYLAAAKSVGSFREHRLRQLAQGSNTPVSPRAALVGLRGCLDRGLDVPDPSVDVLQIEEALAKAKQSAAFRDFEQSLAHAQAVLARLDSRRHPHPLIRALLLKARALHVLGKPIDARRSVDLAYVHAQAQDDLSLRLKAAVLRSKIMVRQGLFQASVEAMRDAWPLAQKPEVSADAKFEYFSKACLVDRRDQDPCGALNACRAAQALADRASLSAIEQSEIERRMAWLAYEFGRIDEAVALAKTAQRRIKAFAGPTSGMGLDADALLVSLMAEQQRVLGAQAAAYEALARQSEQIYARYLERYGATSYVAISARSNLAELNRRAGRLHRAQALFKQQLANEADDAERYFTLVGYGKTLIALGEATKGRKMLHQAISDIQGIERRGQARGANPQIPEKAEAWLALAQAQPKPAKARRAAQKALELYEGLEQAATQQALECPELGPAQGLYEHERSQAKRWLERGSAASGRIDDLGTGAGARQNQGIAP